MVARNHIITGTASAVCLGAAVYTLAYNVDVGMLSVACSRLIEQAAGVNSLYKLCAIPLFVLGLILPDCDLRTSVVGRFFHLPCKHRTWTHSVWFVLPSVIAGIYGFGLCGHWLLPLSFTTSGIACPTAACVSFILLPSIGTCRAVPTLSTVTRDFMLRVLQMRLS